MSKITINYAMQATLIIVLSVVINVVNISKLSAADNSIKYFILTGTMEPLMIVEPDDPMAGGMFTEIIKEVFAESPYNIEPMVMPWQRMTGELKNRDDWIMHGIPAFFEPDIPYKLSKTPVFPFNHIAVSRKESQLEINTVKDLFGKTVILVENYHYSGLDNFLDNPLVGKGSGDIQSVRAFKPDGTLKILKHNRGDVVIGFQPRLLYHFNTAGLSVEDVDFHDVSAIIPTEQMHVAYSPKLPKEFSIYLNRRLEEMQKDGSLTRIKEKYYGSLGLP